MRFREFLRFLIPLGPQRRRELARIRPHISDDEFRRVRFLLKAGRSGIHYEGFGERLIQPFRWPQLSLSVEDAEAGAFLDRINAKIADKEKLTAFERFAPEAIGRLTGLVAPQIIGMEGVKRAAAAQLFTTEPVHILLIGDPGTGKTEVLRSIEELAPHSRFGLGSGTSNAGLVGMYEGGTFKPGLLVQADEGMALIDELNLLKKQDQAGLYSAMEQGSCSYDKGGKHERFDARVRVLATANPKGDRFIGKDPKFLKSQLPFDLALLSRFHLTFIIRAPSEEQLKRIAKQIVTRSDRQPAEADLRFAREYIAYAAKRNIAFDARHEEEVVSFIADAKRDEGQTLIDIGPRLVVGVIRLAKGFARARLSRRVDGNDVAAAVAIFSASLKVLSDESTAS